MMQGNIQAMFDTLPLMMPQIRDGAVRYDFTANPGPDAVWQEIPVPPV